MSVFCYKATGGTKAVQKYKNSTATHKHAGPSHTNPCPQHIQSHYHQLSLYYIQTYWTLPYQPLSTTHTVSSSSTIPLLYTNMLDPPIPTPVHNTYSLIITNYPFTIYKHAGPSHTNPCPQHIQSHHHQLSLYYIQTCWTLPYQPLSTTHTVSSSPTIPFVIKSTSATNIRAALYTNLCYHGEKPLSMWVCGYIYLPLHVFF